MIMALWDVTPCKFINWDHFRHTCYLHLGSQKISNKETKLSRYTEWEHQARLCTILPWRWNQLIPLKHWFISTQLKCVTSYETIFKITAETNSCLARRYTSSTYFSSFSPLSFNKFVSTRFCNRIWNSILVHWITSTKWARPFCATFYWLLSAI